ncbi:hypothetical protein BGZ90_001858 [Linnemannia elongata]|nr:hypothetical protein BGZ90_001858 [Linnemannia elongata]
MECAHARLGYMRYTLSIGPVLAIKALALTAAVALATTAAADAGSVASETNPLAQVPPQIARNAEVVPTAVAFPSSQEVRPVAEKDASQATGTRLGRAHLARRAGGGSPGVSMMTTHGLSTRGILPFLRFSEAIYRVILDAWQSNDWYGAQTFRVGTDSVTIKWSLPKIALFSQTAIDYLCDDIVRSQRTLKWVWAQFQWATSAEFGGAPQEIAGAVEAYIQ